MFEDNLPLARTAAWRYLRNLPPYAQFDELYADALIGLWKASLNYTEDKGSFKTYAHIRMRGEMIDGLRQRDTVKRVVRNRDHKAESLDPDNFTREGMHEVPFDIAEHTFAAETDQISEYIDLELERAQATWIQTQAVHSLSPKYQYVLRRRLEGAIMSEIAKELGVTESRIQQIITKATNRLKDQAPAELMRAYA